jgi:putative flippase GtrA
MGSFFAILALVSNQSHHSNSLPAMPKKEVMRIIRFGVVGGTGTLLNALMVWFLLSLGNRFFQMDPGSHGAATSAAFLTWVVVCGINYLLNAAWTFHSWPPSWKHARNYYLMAAFSFGFQLLLLNFLLYLLDANRPLETAVLNGVAVASAALINYLLASLWVFRR